MRAHFIAIGGAVMHNLALALHKKGYKVTGSDDEIFEPSKTRLADYGLLPEKTGWFPEKITEEIDTVILGMHARADNPELAKARELKLRIMSFPEFLYEQTKNKKRIVVAGSHGKTTTTAMIMHVMKYAGLSFDYMVGSTIEGFDTMVGLSDDSKIAVLEGDEYLTSPIDRRPKFHLYKPHIAIINGIAWDHMNVFPDFDTYADQFRIFAGTIMPGGMLLWYGGDGETRKLAMTVNGDFTKKEYGIHGHFVNKEGLFAATVNRTVPLKIFGEHNMQNLSAAREACLEAGISEDLFYEAIQSFEGTAKRLQKLAISDNSIIYLDFAHAPSKVRATLEAVISYHRGYDVIACLELHTFSSLNPSFLPQYKGTLTGATRAFVYFSPHAVEMKKLPPLSPKDVADAFGGDNIKVFCDTRALSRELFSVKSSKIVYLFMSSGDFGGTNLNLLATALV